MLGRLKLLRLKPLTRSLNNMAKPDTDLLVAAGGITAPMWVVVMTDWLGLVAAAGAVVLVTIRIWKNLNQPYEDKRK